MNTHDLKTWPEWYEPSVQGKKTVEVRNNDRDYAVGDVLHLREYQPPHAGFPGYYTGREHKAEVTHILTGGQFGVEADYCLLSHGPVFDVVAEKRVVE